MKRYGWVALLLLLIVGLVVGRRHLVDLVRDIVTPDIQVESDMSAVVVSEVNRDRMREDLEQVKWFDEGQVSYYTPSTAQKGSVSARKLIILLTEDKQPLGLTFYTGETEPFQSWGVEYVPRAIERVYDLVLKLYIRADIVQSKDSDELGEWYQGLALRAIWDLTHPQKPEYQGMERFVGADEYVGAGVKDIWLQVEKGEQQ